jgi:hypothetical protein
MDNVLLPNHWRDLYVMLGTSSAALIGLLFVATSLHVKEIVNDDVYRLRAQYTTLILVDTLIEATVILTPLPVLFVGAGLAVANLHLMWLPMNLLLKASTISKNRRRGGFSARRALFVLFAGFVGLGGSISIMLGGGWGLFFVTASYAGCLIFAIWNAWMIMLGIGRLEQKRRR